MIGIGSSQTVRTRNALALHFLPQIEGIGSFRQGWIDFLKRFELAVVDLVFVFGHGCVFCKRLPAKLNGSLKSTAKETLHRSIGILLKIDAVIPLPFLVLGIGFILKVSKETIVKKGHEHGSFGNPIRITNGFDLTEQKYHGFALQHLQQAVEMSCLHKSILCIVP